MGMKAYWAVSVLASILILGVVTIGSSTQAFAGAGAVPGLPGPDVPPFHLKCYNDLSLVPFFDPGTPILEIELFDQFGGGPIEFEPIINGLCASADKFTESQKFLDPFELSQHFTTYPIFGASPEVEVELTDQFGISIHTVLQPTNLLVPANKLNFATGETFDSVFDVHWKCYGIDGDAFDVPLVLTDQFGPTVHFLLTPVELCAPATKIITKQIVGADPFTETFSPPDDAPHLKCYSVELDPAVLPVHINSQFDDQISNNIVDLGFVEKLCTTVTKEIIEEPASIHGMKWNDLNGNGVKDPGEPGISGWGMELVCDVGPDRTALTDAAGNYWFLDIPAPNICTVNEEIRPLTWTPTTATSLTVTLEPGDKIEDQNFGNQKIITPLEDDHYLAYQVKEVKKTPQFKDLKVNVDLKDQFDKDAQTYKVKKPVRLYNPVEKTIGGVVFGINDKSTHYVGYQIRGPHTPVTNIIVENQFGTITVDTTKGVLLLVPSLKNPDTIVDPTLSFPDTVNHFKCYKVKVTKGTPEFEQREVSLKDQFLDKNFLVIKPTLLCNPVEKTVVDADGNSVTTPIVDEDNHLMCYKVKELVKQPKLDKKDKVWTNNQLAPDVFNKLKVKELCLPSEKSLVDLPPGEILKTT